MISKELDEQARAFLLNAGLTNKQISRLEEIGYFEAPASMSHHLNREGGLVEHSINVCKKMLALRVFDDKMSIYRVGMLHDLVKCKCYRSKGDGKGYAYAQPPYPGHGVASALMCADLEISLTPSESAAIVWHMGAFNLDEDQLKEYHAAILRFPRELILTHAADHLASVFETINERRAK